MIQWKFLTRNCKTPEKFKLVYDTRVALKKAGKKKEQAPFKIILNSQYGITKDKYSEAYDPVQANNICINGQLMLLDLIEHLEAKLSNNGFELLNSNTDGIIVAINDDDWSDKLFKHICQEWCFRTKMGLGFDEIGVPDRIGKNGEVLPDYVSKDVNNYVFIFSNGKLERKGAYVKELSDLDYNLPIVNEAVVKYISEGISIEETVDNCNEFIKFQIIFRVSRSYKYAVHNNKRYTEKTFRVFASTDINDGYLGRCKEEGSTIEKFQNCPDRCFIYNKSVKDVPIPLKLDRKWYINLAKKRLEDFGYEIKRANQLF